MTALQWLQDREEGVPSTLVRQIRHAVQDQQGGSVSDVLRAASDGLIERAVDLSETGEATELLTADALITYVCEAISELAPGELRTVA